MELEALDNLVSKEPGTPAVAADRLYALPDKAAILKEESAAKRLIQSVEQGNRTAASILLLGYAAGSTALLNTLSDQHGDEPVKVKPWSRTVPLRIAAAVALARHGDRSARVTLLRQIPEYQPNVRVFLLDVMADIDAPEIWQQLALYLDDETEIPEGVPSGAARRRLADHAVDAFLDRWALPVSFPRNPGGRYTVEQKEETVRLFRELVPR